MDIVLAKKVVIFSAILGLFLGGITIIPFINAVSFLVLMLFASSAVLIYMKKFNLIGFITPKEAAIYGGIIGFVSFLAFCVSFIPIAAIIGIFVKASIYSTMKNFVTTSVFITLIIAVFIAFLSGLLNSFSAMATVFIQEQLKPTKFQDDIDIDITIDN